MPTRVEAIECNIMVDRVQPLTLVKRPQTATHNGQDGSELDTPHLSSRCGPQCATSCHLKGWGPHLGCTRVLPAAARRLCASERRKRPQLIAASGCPWWRRRALRVTFDRRHRRWGPQGLPNKQRNEAPSCPWQILHWSGRRGHPGGLAIEFVRWPPSAARVVIGTCWSVAGWPVGATLPQGRRSP